MSDEQDLQTMLDEANERMDRLLSTCGVPTKCGSQGRPGCGQPIVFLKTKNNRSAPFDYNGGTHFATCEVAGNFRKGKPRG